MSATASIPLRYATDHAHTRLRERYGMRLDDQQWAEIIADISTRRGLLISRQDERREVWAVVSQGVAVRVVFDRVDNRVVTVLDPMARLGTRPKKRRS